MVTLVTVILLFGLALGSYVAGRSTSGIARTIWWVVAVGFALVALLALVACPAETGSTPPDTAPAATFGRPYSTEAALAFSGST